MTTEDYNKKGTLAYNSLILDESIFWFKKSLEILVEQELPNYYIGNCYLRLNEFDLAKEYYKRVLKINNQSFNAHLELAQCYYWQEIPDYDKVIGNCNEAIILNSRASSPYYYKGSSLYQQKKYEDAIVFLKKASFRNSDDYLSLMYEGLCYERLGLYEKALVNYNFTTEIKNDFAIAYYQAGNCLKTLSRTEEAKFYYQKAYELDSSLNDTFFELEETKLDETIQELVESAWNAYNNYNYQEAIEYLEIVIKYDYEFYLNFHMLALCYEMIGDYNKAIYYFEKSIALDSEYKEDEYKRLADCHESLRQYQSAVDYLELAIKCTPYNTVLLEQAGKLYVEIEDYDRAEYMFNELVQIDDNKLRGNLKLISISIAKQDFSAAITKLEELLKTYPTSEDIYDDIGYCYYLLKEYNIAIDNFNKALNLNPELHESLWGKGMCFLNKNQYTSAKSCFEKSIEYSPEWVMPYSGLGETYNSMAIINDEKNQHHNAVIHYNKAKNYFKTAISLDRDYGIPFLHLSSLPQDIFDINEASKISNFYRFIYLAGLTKINRDHLKENVQQCIEQAKKYESPLLPFIILNKASINSYNDFYFDHELTELSNLTDPFRTLFYLWNDRQHDIESFKTDALLNFYMGNPIRTYDIYNSQAQSRGIGLLSKQDQYYFISSAQVILENDNPSIKEILKLNKEQSTVGLSSQELYYSALILLEDKNFKEAKSIFERLIENNFEPAFFKNIQLKYKDQSIEEIFDSNLITEILNDSRFFTGYFANPKIVNLPEDEKDMLAKLTPLIYYMENIDIIHIVEPQSVKNQKKYRANISDKPYFFTNMVNLPYLQGVRRKEHIKRYYPEKYDTIFDSDLDQEVMSQTLKFYRRVYAGNVEELFFKLGKEIYSESTIMVAELLGDIKNPKKINYLFYINLVYQLYEEGILTEKHCRNHINYIIYCSEQVQRVKPESIIYSTLIDKLTEICEEAIKWPLSKVSLIGNIILKSYYRIQGKERYIILFEQFIQLQPAYN